VDVPTISWLDVPEVSFEDGVSAKTDALMTQGPSFVDELSTVALDSTSAPVGPVLASDTSLVPQELDVDEASNHDKDPTGALDIGGSKGSGSHADNPGFTRTVNEQIIDEIMSRNPEISFSEMHALAQNEEKFSLSDASSYSYYRLWKLERRASMLVGKQPRTDRSYDDIVSGILSRQNSKAETIESLTFDCLVELKRNGLDQYKISTVRNSVWRAVWLNRSRKQGRAKTSSRGRSKRSKPNVSGSTIVTRLQSRRTCDLCGCDKTTESRLRVSRDLSGDTLLEQRVWKILNESPNLTPIQLYEKFVTLYGSDGGMSYGSASFYRQLWRVEAEVEMEGGGSSSIPQDSFETIVETVYRELGDASRWDKVRECIRRVRAAGLSDKPYKIHTALSKLYGSKKWRM
jgi:hypothetical protein